MRSTGRCRWTEFPDALRPGRDSPVFTSLPARRPAPLQDCAELRRALTDFADDCHHAMPGHERHGVLTRYLSQDAAMAA